MTETRLFTVAKAATLIAKYTGQSKFDVAKDIEVAAWTHYAKPGHGKPLEVYTENGRRSRYRPGLYGYTLDPNITDPLEEKRVFTEYVPYLHLLVDLKEVLDALEYHPDIRKKIIASIGQAEGAGTDVVKPVPRQRAQETAILEKLRELGYDPQALPPYGPGQRSAAKAGVEAALGNKGMWTGATVFDKAWGRLTGNNEIAYTQ